MKHVKNTWSSGLGPWLAVLLVLYLTYIVLVDTKLAEGIVGGF